MAKTRLIFDIETDGLLATMTVIHCLHVSDGKGQFWDFADQEGFRPISEGIAMLQAADIIIGHNIIAFDIPAIQIFYPDFKPKQVTDTLLLSRILFPDIWGHARVNSRVTDKRLHMSHGLKAWGARLGFPKGDYADVRAKEVLLEHPELLDLKPTKRKKAVAKIVWSVWTPPMHDYCKQDVVVSVKLYRFLVSKKMLPDVVRREHLFADAMQGQMKRGWVFNMRKALALYALLSEEESKLHTSFLDRWPGWYRPGKVTRPKKNRSVKMKGQPDITLPRYSTKTGERLKDYVGPPKCDFDVKCPYTPIKFRAFNPGSRPDCIHVLKKHFGWKPSKFTEKNMAKMDEAVLKSVKREIPLAEELIDFYTLRKRMGQIADGKQAWIGHAKEVSEGVFRIFGSINTMGAATHRCTHSSPNLAQVPKAAEITVYGKECRELFEAEKGMLLVGSDADALELRLLGHYLQPLDGGDMIEAIMKGSKAEGTDPHSRFRDMIGTDLLGEGNNGREKAKTLRYALMYGAGKGKAGRIVDPAATEAEAVKIGNRVFKRMDESGEGTGALIKEVKKIAQDTGHLEALDGRILPVRHYFAALNTLLQSAGAIFMKEVLNLHRQGMADAGYPVGGLWHYVGNIHDEFQAEVDPSILDIYKEVTLNAYVQAGNNLGCVIPMLGSVDVGSNWAETH